MDTTVKTLAEAPGLLELGVVNGVTYKRLDLVIACDAGGSRVLCLARDWRDQLPAQLLEAQQIIECQQAQLQRLAEQLATAQDDEARAVRLADRAVDLERQLETLGRSAAQMSGECLALRQQVKAERAASDELASKLRTAQETIDDLTIRATLTPKPDNVEYIRYSTLDQVSFDVRLAAWLHADLHNVIWLAPGVNPNATASWEAVSSASISIAIDATTIVA